MREQQVFTGFQRYIQLIEEDKDDYQTFQEVLNLFEAQGLFENLPEPDKTKAAIVRVALVTSLDLLNPSLRKGDVLLGTLMSAMLTAFTAGAEYGQEHPEWCILLGS